MLVEALWFLGLGILWLGAWMDWKDRRVPNLVWAGGLIIAAPFLLVEAFTEPMAFLLRLLGTAVAGGVAWILWRAGQFGGADAKAIMVAGLLLSPVGYWRPDAAQFLPILDALAAGLLVAEVWRRMGRQSSTPFLVALAPLATASFAFGGLVWWPVVWLGRLLEVALH